MSMREMNAWTQGGFSIEGDCIWFVPYMLNVLCKYNMSTKTMEEMRAIPDVDSSSAGFYNVIRVKHYVIMIPGFEKNICVYFVQEGRMETVVIPDEVCGCERFQYAVQHGENLYLFPMGYSCILKVSLDTLAVEKVFMNGLHDNMFTCVTNKEHKAFLVNDTNKLYVFDMLSGLISVEYTFEDNVKWRTVAFLDDDRLILSDWEGNVYVYCLSDSQLKVLYQGKGIKYDSCVCWKNKVLLVPQFEKDYFDVFDVESGCKREIWLHNHSCYREWSFEVFSKPLLRDTKVYIFSTQYRTLLEYNLDTDELKECVLEYGEMELREMKSLYDNSIFGGGVKEGFGPHATLEILLKVLLMEE